MRFDRSFGVSFCYRSRESLASPDLVEVHGCSLQAGCFIRAKILPRREWIREIATRFGCFLFFGWIDTASGGVGGLWSFGDVVHRRMDKGLTVEAQGRGAPLCSLCSSVALRPVAC